MALSHLNSAQNRVQSMKDDLKNLEQARLDTFLQGISNPEPPHYQQVNNKTEPKLDKVVLKDHANCYHIGNVFMSEDNTVQWISLIVEHNEVEAYTSNEVPKDPMNPLTIPIPDSVVLDLIPLFSAKFAAIKERCDKINDTRAFARATLHLQGRQHVYGKVSSWSSQRQDLSRFQEDLLDQKAQPVCL
jgi:hypothetical protein